jgi:general secretion pathway protein H
MKFALDMLGKPEVKARKTRGLTLIEILVVLLILGLILYSLTLSLGSASQAEIIRTTNQLAATTRFAYDRARFTGDHYRLHINIDERSFALQAASEAMYLPATNRDGEVIEIDTRKLEARDEADKRAEERFNQSLESQIRPGAGAEGEFAELDPYAAQAKSVPRRKPPLFDSFEAENTLSDLGEPIVFPESVKIVSVRTDADFVPITSGEADIYFFPSGRTQLAHILYTIIVQPLTGEVTVESELIDLQMPGDVLDGEDDLGGKLEMRSF